MNSRVRFQNVYRRLKGLYRQQNQTLAEELLAMKDGWSRSARTGRKKRGWKDRGWMNVKAVEEWNDLHPDLGKAQRYIRKCQCCRWR